MKKVLFLFITFIGFSSIAFSSGCKKTDGTASKISQLRDGIYIAEDDELKIEVFSEMRESPFIEDGNPSELKPLIVILVTPVGDSEAENADMFACVETKDEKYSAQFVFKPISPRRECYIRPKSKLHGNFTLIITINGEKKKFVPTALNLENTIGYERAISAIKSSDGGKLSEYFSNEEYGEIMIRLIENDGALYWYVGFTDGNETTAYLVDGKTAEILESRTSPVEKINKSV